MLLTTTLISISSSFAFTIKETEAGQPLRWRSFPVSYTWAGGTPDDLEGAEAEVAAAFRAWEQVTGTEIAFSTLAPEGAAEPTEAPDSVNWVWMSEDWPFDPELLALTSSWTTVDGTLLAFDIRLNGTRPWASDGRADAYDLRAAVVHEVGHVLGLDHSDVEEATMYATSGAGEAWRANLALDDEEGARYLYAMAPSAAGSPFGCATQGTGLSAAGALAVGLLGIRRARAR